MTLIRDTVVHRSLRTFVSVRTAVGYERARSARSREGLLQPGRLDTDVPLDPLSGLAPGGCWLIRNSDVNITLWALVRSPVKAA